MLYAELTKMYNTIQKHICHETEYLLKENIFKPPSLFPVKVQIEMKDIILPRYSTPRSRSMKIISNIKINSKELSPLSHDWKFKNKNVFEIIHSPINVDINNMYDDIYSQTKHLPLLHSNRRVSDIICPLPSSSSASLLTPIGLYSSTTPFESNSTLNSPDRQLVNVNSQDLSYLTRAESVSYLGFSSADPIDIDTTSQLSSTHIGNKRINDSKKSPTLSSDSYQDVLIDKSKVSLALAGDAFQSTPTPVFRNLPDAADFDI